MVNIDFFVKKCNICAINLLFSRFIAVENLCFLAVNTTFNKYKFYFLKVELCFSISVLPVLDYNYNYFT